MSTLSFPSDNELFSLEPINGKNYIINEPLQEAVETALLLGRPLLLTGAAGVGKTDLAQHLALALSKQTHGLVSEILLSFNVRTTAVASDLLYRYDALGHYHVAQVEKKILDPTEIRTRFITPEALGEAILNARGLDADFKKLPEDASVIRVVLIDEIDKAPRDLPNDLLDVLDKMRFEIPELRHKDQPDLWRVGFDNTPVRKPIVILTSNSDKSLPEPFLRRCVYYHIPEHTSTELSTIAITRLRQKPDNIDGYLAHFYDLITQLHEKKPATAELLQWLWYCQRKHVDLECLQTVASEKRKAPLEMRRKVWASYSVLIKSQHDWEELGARYFDKETNKA